MGNSITQKLKYKQSVIKFSFKYGVTKAAIKFEENRRTIYRWIERYDGTLESLKDKSRRPNSHPKEHTEEEIKMMVDQGQEKGVIKKNEKDLINNVFHTRITRITRLRVT